MILIGQSLWYTVEESKELLSTIFPNYPDVNPCNTLSKELYPPDNPACKFPVNKRN